MAHTAAPITLLLVDDQAIILDGLEALLGQEAGMLVIGRATNGREAVEQAALLKPDVVIMDISMPQMDGIEATRLVVKANPECKVLVLSMYNNKEFVRELLDAGATGYILKNAGRVELRDAVNAVAMGSRFLSEAVLASMGAPRDRGDSPKEGSQLLTKREKEILSLIACGKSSCEVAAELYLSTQTIDTHRKNIMHKLDARNMADLVKYAMERGWNV